MNQPKANRPKGAAGAADSMNGHDENPTARSGFTSNGVPLATEDARREEPRLRFPELCGLLHPAMESLRLGGVTVTQIDRLMAEHLARLVKAHGEGAADRLTTLAHDVLSQPIPHITPLDALHIVIGTDVAGGDTQAALDDMRAGMHLGEAHLKHVFHDAVPFG